MHRSRLIPATLLLAFVTAHGCRKEKAGGEAAPLETQAAHAALETGAPSAASSPADIVYAASAHVRVVDTARGKVVAGIDLQKAISSIAFTPDGSAAFVAASDGVVQVDTSSNRVLGQITSHPARHVALDESGTKLFILEHEVIVAPDGTRDVQPFRVMIADVRSGELIGREEIGQRILYALPSASAGRNHLVITESGELRLGRPPTPLAEGKAIDLVQGMPSAAPLRVRETVATKGTRAFVPVEGAPSRILEIDLERGDVTPVSLGGALQIRGLALSHDGRFLVVNAVKELMVVDLATRAVRGKVELDGAHQGLAISADGKWAYLAQTIDGTGGGVTIVRLDPLGMHGKVHLDDISPWAIAVRPRTELAERR